MKTSEVSLAIVYKNFAASSHVSHIGLGVAGINNAKVLQQLGLRVDVVPIVDAKGLIDTLSTNPYTHVVISAPWIPTREMQEILLRYPRVQFYMNCHSNVGFLQADSHGVKLFREGLNLEQSNLNFHVAGNSEKFTRWVHEAFADRCDLLPNCYYLDHTVPPGRILQSPDPVRIGVFGATRPLKNMMSAAGAALLIARRIRVPLELWLSSGRTEGGGDCILRAVQEMMKGLPGVTVHYNGWQTWPDFRKLIANMHLLLQPSYTESFNMVTADGVAEGVASVVTEAIDWVPENWKGNADDVEDLAAVGIRLLRDQFAGRDGLRALIHHNRLGTKAWARSLGITDLPEYHLPHPVGESL